MPNSPARTFERVDLGPLIEQIVAGWESRRETGDARIAFARPRKDTAVVMGKPDRLARAINNILDNAVSFSPPAAWSRSPRHGSATRSASASTTKGPAFRPKRVKRSSTASIQCGPKAKDFGRHSGLGLAIARAIVEGHDGEIDVQDRDDAPSGARFTIRLPAADRA